MTVLVTGVVGFIGFHVARALLDRGERVIGVDSFTDYYDVNLKEARADLLSDENFSLFRIDIADKDAVQGLADQNTDIDRVVHLAAQAGVRYSLENPYAYVHSNVLGQVAILELARRLPRLRHLVYASSSSVYGGNEKRPFSVGDPADKPLSIYAATKRADELFVRTYCHLYGISATGLRFFTVYGPFGRPDMAYFSFTRSIFEDRPIRVFNEGRMKRDFTEINDIVAGTLAALDQLPPPDADGLRHRIFNLGNNRPEELMRFIDVLGRAIGKTPQLEFEPMQAGDVEATFADIEPARRDLGFSPSTSIETGLIRFVDWYRRFYGI